MSESITVRVTMDEKNMAEKLAGYLFKAGKVDEPTISNAVRLSIRFTVGEILKAIEVERYGR